MSFSKVHSAQNVLLEARPVSVEVDLSKGLNAFSIVGLPDKAVEESKDRISAAVKNCGFVSPKQKNQKVVISLAPADLKKEGPIFDLPMALGYLLSSRNIKFNPEKKLFLGELSLDGTLCPIKGVLPIVQKAKEEGVEEVYLPKANAEEAALIDGIKVFGVKSLREVLDHLDEKRKGEPGEKSLEIKLTPQEKTRVDFKKRKIEVDFADIKGQESAKRGMEIAAAGGHNISMYGPPGTGKTMLAKAFTYILPPLSFDESLEVTGIHSTVGNLKEPLIVNPPFRAPHHTSSHTSVVGGGGTIPKPGEITLAHRGVLFLDEFPEFDRRVVEALRQPLEERSINISRTRGSAWFPANFILIAAMNPCPCGNFGVKDKICTCPPGSVQRYQRKISGPITDRIDLWLEVSKIDYEKLSQKSGRSQSEKIRERVLKTREIQKRRWKGLGLKEKTNSQLSAKDLSKHLVLPEDLREKLNDIARKLDLSARAYHKVLKLARTIADLEESEDIKEVHLLEALQYRPKAVSSL